MRHPRALRSFMAATIVSALVVIDGSVATAAPAYVPTLLPILGNRHDIAVHDSSRHVFVSGGRDQSQVVMLDFQGEIVTTLDDISGPMGLEIVDDVLYVAARGSASIERFDLSTSPPTRLPGFSTRPNLYPRDLMYASGRLWFGSDCSASSNGRIVGMALDGSSFVYVPPDGPGNDWTYCSPDIDGGRYGPNLLMAQANSIGSGGAATLYDISTSPPTMVHTQRNFVVLDFLPMPSGLTFARPTDEGISEYSTQDFSGPLFTYKPAGGRERSIDVTASGPTLLAAAGETFYSHEPEVSLFRLGSAVPFRTINLPPDPLSSSSTNIHTRGVAVAADASRVFILSGGYQDAVVFHAIDPDALPSSLTLSTSASEVEIGASVELVADLEPAQPGEEVTIYGRDSFGDTEVVAQGEVDENGEFRTQYEPTEELAYEAKYEGSETLMWSTSASRTIDVRTIATIEMLRSSGTKGAYAIYPFGKAVRARGSVAPVHAGHEVFFDVWRLRDGIWHPYRMSHEALLGRESRATFILRGLERGKYRTLMRMHDHEDHLGSASRYALFKVV